MRAPHHRLHALGLLAIAPGLAAVAPTPAAAVARINATWTSGWDTGSSSSPTLTSADPTVPLLAAVALAAWACTAWLLLVAAVTCADRLPGTAGLAARHAGSWIAPRSVRTLVRVAVGTSLAASVFVGPTALAADGPSPGAPVASASASATASATSGFDWPTTGSAGGTPQLAHPARSSPVAIRPGTAAGPAVAVRPGAAVGPGVVVLPGDSLWSIAAHALGPGASHREVAQTWPQWWSTNRTVLGENPDLIHPGTHLTAPQP